MNLAMRMELHLVLIKCSNEFVDESSVFIDGFE